MKYVLAVKETFERVNRYVIDVFSEEEGEIIADNVENRINEECMHPDDVQSYIEEEAEIVEIIEGAEDFEAELTDSYAEES